LADGGDALGDCQLLEEHIRKGVAQHKHEHDVPEVTRDHNHLEHAREPGVLIEDDQVKRKEGQNHRCKKERRVVID
jgi:hypothetical protein